MNSFKKIFVVALLYSLPVFPWGKVGHETIAYIAEQNLSPITKEKMKPLLSGESLEDVSIWADEYKQSHRNTGPWHYLDLPVRQNVTVNNIFQYYSNSQRPED